jgi:hypothetical protein
LLSDSESCSFRRFCQYGLLVNLIVSRAMVADAAVEWAQTSAELVELDFVDAVGAEQRLRLSSCAAVRFEDARPVRRFRWSRGLGHFPG